ncbi:MAG TPA: cytochrome b/b6 domain-containing protein [Acetobacteraceae bacterium]|nr:cytochrome b/b6 domain-containing protein [Acetobacteraceae bacterium]
MQRVYVHPLPVRIWHWTNAAGCTMLALTGLQIRYIGTINVVPFRIAVQIHNWIGFIIIANYFLWFCFYVSSDRIRAYLPDLHPVRYFRDAMQQALYYSYGVFRGLPNPHHVSKYHLFNPLQAITYQLMMLLVLPLQGFTGVLLWNLTGFAGIVALFGGVRVIDTVHVLIFAVFLFYIPFHAYLGTMGHTPLADYKAMLDGYEEVEEGEHADGAE